jgi:ketosteroid isomerase-like protein
MSRENLEVFKRGIEAYNSRAVEALLEDLDPDVEFRPALPKLLGGRTTVYLGHEGVREMFREFDDAFAEMHAELPDIRDLGDRIVGIGRIRTRGRGSGVETESPWGYVFEMQNGKVIRAWTFLDPKEALEAAGVRE